MAIEAVFFDFDGVLTLDKTGSISTNRFIAIQTGIEFKKISDAMREYNDDLLLGKITHRDIWDKVCLKVGHQINFSILRDAFVSTPVNEKMFSLAHKLRSRYTVGIITDNKNDRMGFLKTHLNLENLFNPVVVSAETGCDKQSHKIFDIALDKVGYKPGECIFIDNNQKNLVVPQEMGLKTIYYDDEKNDVVELERILTEEMHLFVK